jgi:hypothetical protein
MDSLAGIRKMQTLRKLPIAAPKMKAKMFRTMTDLFYSCVLCLGEVFTRNGRLSCPAVLPPYPFTDLGQ